MSHRISKQVSQNWEKALLLRCSLWFGGSNRTCDGLYIVFFIISSVSRVWSVWEASAHSCPCGAPALTSKASLDSERCDVMKREARSSRWDAGAQQASTHRELTTAKNFLISLLKVYSTSLHFRSKAALAFFCVLCGAMTADEMNASLLLRDSLKWRSLVGILWYLLVRCDCYNLDVEHPLIFHGPNGSLFGYSVLLHQHAEDSW